MGRFAAIAIGLGVMAAGCGDLSYFDKYDLAQYQQPPDDLAVPGEGGIGADLAGSDQSAVMSDMPMMMDDMAMQQAQDMAMQQPQDMAMQQPQDMAMQQPQDMAMPPQDLTTPDDLTMVD